MLGNVLLDLFVFAALRHVSQSRLHAASWFVFTKFALGLLTFSLVVFVLCSRCLPSIRFMF